LRVVHRQVRADEEDDEHGRNPEEAEHPADIGENEPTLEC
jgi:hypothetical protein